MHPSLNLLQTARLAFCGLFALAAAGSATAQTGVGLVLSSAATHTFPETTVGTTTTFTVTLTNSVAAAQTAYFGGLAAPFSLAASAPISIPGSGTTTLTLQFSPTATGTFSSNRLSTPLASLNTSVKGMVLSLGRAAFRSISIRW